MERLDNGARDQTFPCLPPSHARYLIYEAIRSD
jgi:hypothetical protein